MGIDRTQVRMDQSQLPLWDLRENLIFRTGKRKRSVAVAGFEHLATHSNEWPDHSRLIARYTFPSGILYKWGTDYHRAMWMQYL